MGEVLIILLMVLLSAYFSGSEISFNASNKMRLKKAAEAGSKTAALAYRISEDFNTALSAILVGNNLANIAASTAATVIAMRLLMNASIDNDGLASLLSTVVMTLIILIFGEIVPKIISKNNADVTVRWFAYPTRILTWILYPIVWLVMCLIHLLSRLWGKDDENAPTVTEEELSSIIETVEEEGVIDGEKSELLQSTLEFDETAVEELMTHRKDVVSIDLADRPEKIAKIIETSRYSRIPVYEDSIDNIVGILFLNRYYKKAAQLGGTRGIDLRSLLIKPCFLHKSMKLPAALEELRNRRTHIAVIVDEFGGTMGIVTMEDILEELVGDIWDESDEIVEELTRREDGSFEVSGEMNVDDFFEEIGFEPSDFSCEYSTVGGWATEMLDADPQVGAGFSAEDGKQELTVRVLEMEEMRVTRLEAVLKKRENEEEAEE